MRKKRFTLSGSILFCLFSVFLVLAGISRYIETDSGNILIHDIDVESYEGFRYGARLFRPLQASSMNQRPAVLIIPGTTGDRYTGDHIAMEFARRGFVVLTIEDFTQGKTPSRNGFVTENHVDAGYTFLATRTFTDHERIGLITYYSGAEKAVGSKHFTDFQSGIFVSPDFSHLTNQDDKMQIFTAKYETNPDFRSSQNNGDPGFSEFPVSHLGMLVNPSVISKMMEQFHKDLAIPNDSPFWFESESQNSLALVSLRLICLFLLIIICTGICSVIVRNGWPSVLRIPSAFIIPVVFFLITGEFMNFFIISVRLGIPVNYLPSLSQIKTRFSVFLCLLFIALVFTLSVKISHSGSMFLSDIIAVITGLLCLYGIIPVLFGEKSGWTVFGITQYRWSILLIFVYTALNSLLIRITENSKFSHLSLACLTGTMYYLLCCSLPAEIMF